METSELAMSFAVNFTVTAQDEGEVLARTALQAVLFFIFTFLLWSCARSSPGLLRHVFAPCAAPGTAGSQAYPGFLGAAREAVASVTALTGLAVGLEGEMVRRFLALNIRLLGFASLLSILLIPIYAALPAARPGNPNDPTSANVTSWSTLQMITINHVPRSDPRVVCAGVACLLYALFYVHSLSWEWRRYATAKNLWHVRSDGVHHAT